VHKTVFTIQVFSLEKVNFPDDGVSDRHRNMLEYSMTVKEPFKTIFIGHYGDNFYTNIVTLFNNFFLQTCL